MEKLIVLGTGHALTTHCYNTCFALERGGEYCLVDAGGGNGILAQMERAGMDCPSIRHLFVTHCHTDHILGVIWAVRVIAAAMCKGGTAGELHLYGHDAAMDAVQAMCRMTLQKKWVDLFGTRILFHKVEDGEKASIMGCETVFFDIASTKMKQFGFSMELPDGKKLTCLGDEPCSPRCEGYARGSDYLLTEAFCLDGESGRYHPHEINHSTVKDAAQLSEKLGARTLLLWHTEEAHLSERRELYTEEAARYFTGNILVPDDLDVIQL